MDGQINVDTTSEQQRLDELRFRITLYKVAEFVMSLCAFIMTAGSLVMVIWSLGGAFKLIALIAIFLVVTSYFTRLTRSMAESEVQAIKMAIDKVNWF